MSDPFLIADTFDPDNPPLVLGSEPDRPMEPWEKEALAEFKAFVKVSEKP